MAESASDAAAEPGELSQLPDTFVQTEAVSDLKCSHYKRHCAFVSPCCNKLYICRFCHNDNESHELDRHAVTRVQCLACSAIQPVVASCQSCGANFGRYFCEICRMYDDTDKEQFHCDDCGICRVGGRDKFFHCPKCDMCLALNLQGSHPCVERVTHSNCPICLEDLHTSRSNLEVLPCGHITHKACFSDMLKKGMYTCPLCCHATVDMTSSWEILDREIADTPMPEEYRDLKLWILCKDCHKTSNVAFHVVGLKCANCGSYNTCRTSNPDSTACDDNPYDNDSSSEYLDSTSEEQGREAAAVNNPMGAVVSRNGSEGDGALGAAAIETNNSGSDEAGSQDQLPPGNEH